MKWNGVLTIASRRSLVETYSINILSQFLEEIHQWCLPWSLTEDRLCHASNIAVSQAAPADALKQFIGIEHL